MKKLIALISMLAIAFLFTGCFPQNGDYTWSQIAEATLAEVTKANANYKESYFTYENIVDGNKMSRFGTEYYVMEGETRYEYFFTSGAWYKTLQTGGWTPAATMGEWAAFSAGRLSILRDTLTYSQNVRKLGGRKYSYHQEGQGPDPDSYIFTVRNGLVTGIEATEYGGSGILMYRTTAFAYTYGGQKVTLPTEFIETVKLSTPENLSINDGILKWDEVEGVGYYSGFIDKAGTRMLTFLQIDSAKINFNEYALSYNWASGIYQITIVANHPTTHIDYRSDQATIEYTYIKP